MVLQEVESRQSQSCRRKISMFSTSIREQCTVLLHVGVILRKLKFTSDDEFDKLIAEDLDLKEYGLSVTKPLVQVNGEDLTQKIRESTIFLTWHQLSPKFPLCVKKLLVLQRELGEHEGFVLWKGEI